MNNVFPNLSNVDAWLVIFSGVGVVQLLRQAPDGLASLWASNARRLLRRLNLRRDGVLAPAPKALNVAVAPIELPRRGRSLDVRGVSVRFGGVIAVDDVSFEVAPERSSDSSAPTGRARPPCSI